MAQQQVPEQARQSPLINIQMKPEASEQLTAGLDVGQKVLLQV